MMLLLKSQKNKKLYSREAAGYSGCLMVLTRRSSFRFSGTGCGVSHITAEPQGEVLKKCPAHIMQYVLHIFFVCFRGLNFRGTKYCGV